MILQDSSEVPTNKLVKPVEVSEPIDTDKHPFHRVFRDGKFVESVSADFGAGYTPPKPKSDPTAPDEKSPHGYVLDSLGRKYPIDEFGERVKKSSRIPGVPSAEWAKLTQKEKDEYKKVFGEKELQPVAAPSIPCQDPNTLWNDIGKMFTEFEDSMFTPIGNESSMYGNSTENTTRQRKKQ